MTNYLTRHLQALINCFGQLGRTPLASFMTCLIIGIALAFPTLLFVSLKNLEGITTHLQETMQITLFLKNNTKELEAKKFVDQLHKNLHIRHIKAISPEEGFKELQEQTGFQGPSLSLPKNPLPWTLIVLPNKIEQMDSLIAKLKKMPEIDALQLDHLWIQRLNSLLSFGMRFFISLAIFLGLAIFLIINNVIRAATQQSRKEIQIIKLIGGTFAFIRRPFLYAGILYGLLGGIIAWQLVDILLIILKEPLYHVATLYQSSFQLKGIGLSNTLILLGSSMLLGLLASWLAVTRYLKKD